MPERAETKRAEGQRCRHDTKDAKSLLLHLQRGCRQVLPGIQEWATALLLKADWPRRVGLVPAIPDSIRL